MVLVSLLKLKRAYTNFFQKVMGYQIYGTCIKLVSKYLPSLPSLSTLIVLIVLMVYAVSTASVLATVTGMEIAKINTSFLTLFWILGKLFEVITLFFTIEVFDVRDVLPLFLDNVDIYCKRVINATLFLSSTKPKTSWVDQVFFASLALVGERFLGVLSIKYISIRSINRPILSGVPIFFYCRLVSFEALGINLTDI